MATSDHENVTITHKMRFDRQKLKQIELCYATLTARNEVRSSKTEEKLRFCLVAQRVPQHDIKF